MKSQIKKSIASTSWEPVEKWYKGIVGPEGHYYHQQVVIPGVLKLLDLKSSDRPSLLDLGCGTGVFAHHLPKECEYWGIDLSPSFIKTAKKSLASSKHHFFVADATKPLPIEKKDFSHALLVLSLQNIEFPELALANAAAHLRSDGRLILVLNHPCFRIPRQSSWQVDEQQKIQYRRIDRYSSPLKIPIHAEPSKGNRSSSTWSFHHPLESYSRWLEEAGFVIERLEEWHSNKVSTGKAAKMENRSRSEFPLFMAISVIRHSKL